MISSSETTQARSSIAAVQQQVGHVLLWLRPDGWQVRARRNAWVAMVANSQRRRDRVAVDRDTRLVVPTGQLRAHVQ